MRDDQRLKKDEDAIMLKWESDHGGYVTLKDYFQSKPHTDEHTANATELLARVNALLAEFVDYGGILQIDPDTLTHISGSKGGAGDGGFRLSDSTTGKPGSAHKSAMAVDIYDIGDLIDAWCTRDHLVKYGLWREAKQWSPGWFHCQTREPKSGNRSFNP